MYQMLLPIKESSPNFPSKLSKFNPFVPNAPFLYPLKTSETVSFPDVFSG